MAAFAELAHLSPPRRTRRDASSPDPTPAADAAASRSLAALIAGEIVPRLILAHGRDSSDTPGNIRTRAADLGVAAFTPLTLAGDPRALLAHVDGLIAQGVAVDELMLDLLAPAARLLGEWWEEDRCDFVEVTMGLWRLQEVVRQLAHRGVPAPWRPGRRALFAAFPGEQHDFGAAMVSEFFHRHGWHAELIVAADMPTLLAAVGREDYDVVGLTVSCDCHSARLPSAVLALRSVSRNPHLRVMIGGRVPNADPALAGRAGADGTASDAREALRVAETLVAAAAAHCGACG